MESSGPLQARNGVAFYIYVILSGINLRLRQPEYKYSYLISFIGELRFLCVSVNDIYDYKQQRAVYGNSSFKILLLQFFHVMHAIIPRRRLCFIYCMGLQTCNGKVPRPLLWAGSRAARGKITVSSKPNSLN